MFIFQVQPDYWYTNQHTHIYIYINISFSSVCLELCISILMAPHGEDVLGNFLRKLKVGSTRIGGEAMFLCNDYNTVLPRGYEPRIQPFLTAHNTQHTTHISSKPQQSSLKLIELQYTPKPKSIH